MARYTKESLERLRHGVDLVDLLGAHIELKRAGGSYKALCPFHEEKSPSFVIQRGDSHYHCFGCGAHGDAIEFLMIYLRLSFGDAVELLAERYHVPMEKTAEAARSGPSRSDLKAAIATASELYQTLLFHTEEGHKALNYLHSRGLDSDFVKRFGLGWAPAQDVIIPALRQKGVSDLILRESGLASRKMRDFFQERILFPICEPSGAIIGFSGRKIREEVFGGKYINTSETPLFRKSRILYGLHLCRRKIAKERRALIVEGQIDALRLIHAGFETTVAGQGTAFGEGQVKELLQLGVREVLLAFDADKAGREASVKVGDLFQKQGVGVRVVCLPEDSDPDSILSKEGPGGFEKYLETTTDYLTFLVEELSRECDLSTPSGKAELVRLASARIREWSDPVLVHESLRKLAHQTGVPEEVVGIAQIYKTQPHLQRRGTVGDMQIDPDRVLEGDCLRWLLLVGKETIELARTSLTAEDFRVPACRKLFLAFTEGGATDLLSLGALIEDDEVEAFIGELLERKINRERVSTLFPPTITKILERNWMERREKIRQKIQEGGDDDTILALVREFDTLKAPPSITT